VDVIRYIVPIFLIALSLIYLILTFNLPEARTGNPSAAMYYPLLIGFALLILSIFYLFNEIVLSKKAEFDNYEVFKDKQLSIQFLIVLAFCLIYSVLFERVGFLISTLLFLLALLFLVNGRRQWITNIVISVAFAFITWYSFAELLGVSLP